MAARTARWAASNPGKVRKRALERRLSIKAAEGYYTDYDIHIIRNLLDHKCYYCGESVGEGGQIDHMVPLSKGGSEWPENLAIACRTCNLDKHAKTVEEFIEWRLRLNLKLSEWFDPPKIPEDSSMLMRLSEAGLSDRCWRSLARVSIYTIQDVIQESRLSLYRVPHFGLKSLLEIEAYLGARNLKLGVKVDRSLKD